MSRPHYHAYRIIGAEREEIFHSSSRALSETIVRLCRDQARKKRTAATYELTETWEGTVVSLPVRQLAASA